MATAQQTDKDILQQFGDSLRSEIIAGAHTQGRTATGLAERSLVNTATDSEMKLIDGAGYIIWGWEEGRRPGKFPPVSKIEQWIEAKGIKPSGITVHSLAFLIARKISRLGTKLFREGGRSGVVTNPINNERLTSLRETFATKNLNVVKSELLKDFES